MSKKSAASTAASQPSTNASPAGGGGQAPPPESPVGTASSVGAAPYTPHHGPSVNSVSPTSNAPPPASAQYQQSPPQQGSGAMATAQVTGNNGSLARSESFVGAGQCDPCDPNAPPPTDCELDASRGRVFVAAVSHVVLGAVAIPFVWVGYGFVAFLSILLITVGSIGCTHLHSLNALRYSACCCMPLNAVRQLHTLYVVTAIFGVLAVACNAIQAYMDDGAPRIFAAIACVLCTVACGALLYGFRGVSELRDLCQRDEVMVTGLWQDPPQQQPGGAPQGGPPPPGVQTGQWNGGAYHGAPHGPYGRAPRQAQFRHAHMQQHQHQFQQHPRHHQYPQPQYHHAQHHHGPTVAQYPPGYGYPPPAAHQHYEPGQMQHGGGSGVFYGQPVPSGSPYYAPHPGRGPAVVYEAQPVDGTPTVDQGGGTPTVVVTPVNTTGAASRQ